MKKQPGISARACIRRNGSLLLSKYKDDRGFWYVMPGGGQRSGETLEECLVREVQEELSVTVTVGGEPQMGKHPDPGQVGHEWVERERLNDILFFPIGIADRVTDLDLNGHYLGEMR